jgi:benzoylformate decarboxylase
MDFVALAKAIGGQKGEVVKLPAKVGAAIRRGVDYVLKKKQSYILDMRTAQETPTTPSLQAATTKMLARYVSQPPLDIFHRKAVKATRGASAADTITNVPIIF